MARPPKLRLEDVQLVFEDDFEAVPWEVEQPARNPNAKKKIIIRHPYIPLPVRDVLAHGHDAECRRELYDFALLLDSIMRDDRRWFRAKPYLREVLPWVLAGFQNINAGESDVRKAFGWMGAAGQRPKAQPARETKMETALIDDLVQQGLCHEDACKVAGRCELIWDPEGGVHVMRLRPVPPGCAPEANEARLKKRMQRFLRK